MENAYFTGTVWCCCRVLTGRYAATSHTHPKANAGGLAGLAVISKSPLALGAIRAHVRCPYLAPISLLHIVSISLFIHSYEQQAYLFGRDND